jgi:phosphatidylcholine synthase
VIDYFTYVAVPALMIYWFNMVPLDIFFSGSTWSLIAAVIIMAVSCYTFANVGMKSDDYYFVGFPAIWNVVVLYFFCSTRAPLTNLITILAACVLTFIPVKFVHPLRVTHWRSWTIPMTVLWAAMTLSLIISKKFPENDWVRVETIEALAVRPRACISSSFPCGGPSSQKGDKGEDEEAPRKQRSRNRPA